MEEALPVMEEALPGLEVVQREEGEEQRVVGLDQEETGLALRTDLAEFLRKTFTPRLALRNNKPSRQCGLASSRRYPCSPRQRLRRARPTMRAACRA